VHSAAPESATCLDCGASLARGQHYCARCGQRADVGRLTVHQIAHDFVHALTHVDRSVLALLRDLALRPGHVARSYAAGARRRYFGPFAFLLIAVGVCSLAIVVTGFTQVQSSAPHNRVALFFSAHPNLLFLLQVPLLALACRAIFFRSGCNYAEYLVLAAYTTGMRTVFVTLVVVPVWLLSGRSSAAAPLLFLYWGLWCIYFGWAAAQFHRTSGLRAALGGAVAAAAAQAATALLVSLVADRFA
jgi:Protein of unknown function (DUF3667)